MAVTQNTYTGDGSTVLFSFTFPYLETTDIKVSLNGTITTAYTLANATTIQFNTAPANGVAIRIYRVTDDAALAATFYPGSAIRSADLNDNFTQNLYVTQEATRDATASIANANTALSAANSAVTASAAATSTANTAASNAASAVTTANTANSAASSAVTTANSASTTATTALNTANTAASNASTALSNSSSALSASATASSNASAAVTTANTAATNASNAVTTANSASTAASNAVTTANTALSTANAASATATTADTKADAAIAAVASSVNYTAIANVASIPASPANNTYIEVADTTGLESFTPLAGKPAGFVGDSGLTARLRYTTTGSTWNWLNYYPNNADIRYLKKSGGTMTGALTLSGAPSSNLHAATKQYVDGYVSALQGDINTVSASAATANTTANNALPKAGGTMTGSITFAGGQTFPGAVTSVSGTAPISVTGTTTPTVSVSAATTSAAGVVQLSDSTSSTSSSTAATSAAVKAVQDFAQVVSTTANAALPKAGGTITGNVDNSGTGYFDLPAGTTAQRPGTANSGMLRYNTDLTQFEGYNGSAWGAIGGGAVGGGTDKVFYENDKTVTTNYTLTTNKNAMTAGPVTINSGITVTVPSGSNWVVV
jgi:chemotaxis protein histidine kinase CheA